MITVRHVKKYNAPTYPDKKQVAEDSSLLRILPHRWRANPVVLGLLATALSVGFSGCSETEAELNEKNVVVTAEKDWKTGVADISKNATLGLLVPKALSEDEAYYIITDVAKKYDVVFGQDSFLLNDAQKLIRFYNSFEYDKTEILLENTLDGYDETKKVGFEYLSGDEYGKSIESMIKKENLQKTFEVTSIPADKEDSDNTMPEEQTPVGLFYGYTENEIKKQATDFFEFCKANGIIE